MPHASPRRPLLLALALLVSGCLQNASLSNERSLPALQSSAPASQQTSAVPAVIPTAVNEPLASQWQPKQIAVLLPLSGKLAASGKQIRDGLQAAAQSLATPAIDLRFYDNGEADSLSLYQQAVNEGADAVIGPLQKEQGLALMMQSLRVPTLFLNVLENRYASNAYQFGMPLEEEAAQLTARAAQKYRHALIVSGSDASSDRAVAALSQSFSEQGGEVVDVLRIARDDQIDLQMQQTLGVDRSLQRKQALEQALNRPLAFQPRRRGDVDVIFFALKPATARHVKPYINAHYAQDLPVMALNTVYGGSAAPVQDIDLEAVEFADMPWLVDFSESMQAQRTRLASGEQSALAQSRLFAFGYDALSLLLQLPQLQQAGASPLNGLSGRLSLLPNGRVQRELSWTRFQGGRLLNAQPASSVPAIVANPPASTP